jgi:hypothetical protein
LLPVCGFHLASANAAICGRTWFLCVSKGPTVLKLTDLERFIVLPVFVNRDNFSCVSNLLHHFGMRDKFFLCEQFISSSL